MLLPALALGVTGWLFVRSRHGDALRLATDTTALLWLTVGIVVAWVLWLGLIVRAYLRRRPKNVSGPVRLAGTLGVVALCLAVTAPMAAGARYAMVQHDLIGTVFGEQATATAPRVTAANPWGDRTRVNVLLLGGDGAIHRPGVRTDSVILVSIDTRTGRAVMFSLPRNLQRVPFKAGSKLAALYPDGFTDGNPSNPDNAEYFLNAVYRNVPAVHPGILGRTSNEGADAVKLAVSGALDLPVDYYVLVNLDGFRQLVEAIGGITVNINEPVPIGGNTDAHILPDGYLQPGPNQLLNGFQALWFTRGRYGSSDYQRMERQRCALNAIANEASPLKVLERYTRLASATKDIVRTDISSKLLPAFVDLAGKVKKQRIKSVSFERSAKFDPNDPDFDYVHAAVRAALNPVRKSAGSRPAGTDPGKLSDATEDCAYHPVPPSPR